MEPQPKQTMEIFFCLTRGKNNPDGGVYFEGQKDEFETTDYCQVKATVVLTLFVPLYLYKGTKSLHFNLITVMLFLIYFFAMYLFRRKLFLNPLISKVLSISSFIITVIYLLSLAKNYYCSNRQ